MTTGSPFNRSENTPHTIQKLLDENAHLIRTIVENMNMKGKAMECIQYQQLLHKNLVYLASLADPYLNIQAVLPPPNSSNLIQSQRATLLSQQQQQQQQQQQHMVTTSSSPSLSSNSTMIPQSSVLPPSTTLQQQQQRHQQMQQQQQQVAMTSIGATTSNQQPWTSATTQLPNSMAPSYMQSNAMMHGGGGVQYGIPNSPWSQGSGGVGSYGMQQRMPSSVINPMIMEEQRRQALRLRQKQFLQMQQVRHIQQQQQQHQQQMGGQGGGVPPPGMGMYGPPSGVGHVVPNSVVMPAGMPPSYNQLTTSMGGSGGIPPHSLSQGMPGGPGPMPM